MTLLHASEREDFLAELASAGFDATDFALTEHEDPPNNPAIYAITGHVVVTRKRVSISRSYPAGYGTSWVASFREELCSGGFGRP
jgi:hypothetical protein